MRMRVRVSVWLIAGVNGALPWAEIGNCEDLASLSCTQRAEGQRAVLPVEHRRRVDAPVAELGAKQVERGRSARLAVGQVCAPWG